MHITEGILSGPVLLAGTALAAAGIAQGLRKMSVERTPQTAMVAAIYFTASLIHIPIGPASTHLVLNGLAGILLGWAAFPALAVALLLQAIMFRFGGLTVLGVNSLIVAMPAVIVHYVFRLIHRSHRSTGVIFAVAAVMGAAAVAGSIILQATALAFSGRAFINLAAILALAHAPVVIADGFITGTAVLFLYRVRPDLLVQT